MLERGTFKYLLYYLNKSRFELELGGCCKTLNSVPNFGIVIITGSPDNETIKHVPLTEEKLIDLIESAYPNPVTAQDLAR